jgi:hypothetical protein
VKLAPFIATSTTSIRNLDSYSPSTASIAAPKLSLISQAIQALSGERLKDTKLSLSDQKKASLTAAHAENLSHVSGALGDSLDPALHTDLATASVYGIAAGANPGDQNYMMATAVQYLMRGQIGFVGKTIGGLDYHGQAQNIGATGTRSQDKGVGSEINKVIRVAFAEQKNVIVVFTADGACAGIANHNAATVWTGDRGVLGGFVAYLVLGDPATAVPSRNLFQVGSYRSDNGTVADGQFSKDDISGASVLAAFILRANGVSPSEVLNIFPIFKDVATLNSVMPFNFG